MPGRGGVIVFGVQKPENRSALRRRAPRAASGRLADLDASSIYCKDSSPTGKFQRRAGLEGGNVR